VSPTYEKRLSVADTPERRPLAGASLGSDVELALPPGDPKREAMARRSAGLTVTDYILRHGCRGPGCKRGHKAHVAAAMDALMALDLVADPDGNERSKWRYGQAPKGSEQDVAGPCSVQGPP
jgi:hypothetical protein